MKPEHFVYWLQGFFEISDSETLSKEQVAKIKRHLNLVFKHIDEPDPTGQLNEIHGPGTVYRC